MSPKHKPEIDFELSDEELRNISGAMDCATAKAVATAYESLSKVLGAEGDVGAAAIYAGMANGVAQGGCA